MARHARGMEDDVAQFGKEERKESSVVDAASTGFGWRLASFAADVVGPSKKSLLTQSEIWDGYLAWCARQREEPMALANFDRELAKLADTGAMVRVQHGANVHFEGVVSVEKLHELARDRGETIPRDPLVEQALLAQERFMGRAEKTYDRDKARIDMNRLVDRIEDFPRARAGEFGALKQLRAYAEERAVQLAEQRKLEKEDEQKRQTPAAVAAYVEMEEAEDEEERGL